MKNFIKKHKATILSGIGVLFGITLSVSFGYFILASNGVINTNISATSGDVDTLIFKNGDPIELEMTQFNFGQGDGDLKGETIATVTYTNNSTEGTATDTYDLYFEINENTYEYSDTENLTPELILTVSYKDATSDTWIEITEINGLTYITSDSDDDVSGFDVTTKTGDILIVDDFEISTTDQKIHEWKIELTIVNLEVLQTDNLNKVFNCNLAMIKDYEVTTLATTIMDLVNTTQGDGEVVDENGYRYEGSNPNNYVTFNDETWRIIGVFETDVVNEDGSTTQESLVKIVKEESIGDYSWDENNVNNWPTSTLYAYLNGDYYNSVDTTYIENVIWELGGVGVDTYTADEFYEAERGLNGYSTGTSTAVTYSTTTEGYVGLIYMSDYGYAVLEDSCSRSLEVPNYDTSSECYSKNWLYTTGSAYWTIVPLSSYSYYAWYVYYSGNANDNNSGSAYGVLPVLYLKSAVEIDSGTGAEGDPYILSM